ncbi:MAG: flagellar protein FlgN [Solirubrobacterales bacterium]
MPDVLSYEDLVWCCTNLCDLLEVENEALARHDASTVHELSENKAALARIYEQTVLPLAEDPSLADALEPEQREELTELGRRLQELVEANARMLKAEMEARQRLMDAVVSAVKSNSNQNVTYGRRGAFDSHLGPEANSVSFNQTL